MKPSLILLAMLCIAPLCPAQTRSTDALAELRQSLAELRNDYEERISNLEQRLTLAEQRASLARTETAIIAEQAAEALETAEDLALAPVSTLRTDNIFNPAIGLILVGTAGSQISSAAYSVPGFSLPEESGPVEDGFSLGESELNINSNIDDKFFGNLTLAIASDGMGTEVELEEAYIQTLAMPGGINMTAGRFFSGVGYLNGFHTHADDFVDRPISYDVFLGGQFKDDGIQVRWILPTEHYIEVGGEILRGDAFPGAGAANDGNGTWTLFAESGGDIGISNSWKVGLGIIHANVIDRPIDPGDEGSKLFSGDSDLYNLNFVWKWAPRGNPVRTNFKLQGEYFSREEEGRLDLAAYTGDQTGWYLQGNWQFKPQWQIGYRYGRVDADNNNVTGTVLEDDGPSVRNSLLVAWANSEFSRFKLQFIDQSGLKNDNRWVLQYIHSLGAHGAHRF